MPGNQRLELLVAGLLYPGEVDRFVALAAATEASELPELAWRVRRHLAEIEKASANDAGVDVEVAVRIAAALEALLADPHRYDEKGRALVRGAVEYFVLDRDDDPDSEPGVGLDDDARVLNAVLVAIGRPELRVEPGAH